VRVPCFAQRYNIGPVISYHYAGFTAAGTVESTRADWLILGGFPVVVGGLCAAFNVEIQSATALLTACSLLVGAMLSLYVFVVNLRIKISETEKLRKNRRLHRLVAYSASSCLYVALVALAATVALALFAGVHVSWLSGHGLVRISYGLIFALLTHLALTLVTVVRRIFGIYFDIFRQDFNPEIYAVDEGELRSSGSQSASP
jgi:hypothetical protein